jgi:hypothetical protein
MRENGWLQEVFAAASKRVDEWPEWKKEIESRKSASERKESEPKDSAQPQDDQKAE